MQAEFDSFRDKLGLPASDITKYATPFMDSLQECSRINELQYHLEIYYTGNSATLFLTFNNETITITGDKDNLDQLEDKAAKFLVSKYK